MRLFDRFRLPGFWAAAVAFGGLATLMAIGCGGDTDSPGLTTKQHAKNVNVSGVKSLGMGRAMPFAGLMATFPATIMASSDANAVRGNIAFNPALDLYPGTATVVGNKQTTPYFKDAGLTDAAGSISYTTPGATYSTNYASYPAVVVMDFDLTKGRMPAQGTVQIEYLDNSGANNMTGQVTLSAFDLVVDIDMKLNGSQDVTGELDFAVLGIETRFFNMSGKLNGNIAGDLEMPSLGWTGTATINLTTGSFVTAINTGSGVINASLDQQGHLDITYTDGSTEEVMDPIGEPLIGGGGATNGGTNTTGGNTTGTNTTGTNTTGTNTTGTTTTAGTTGGEYKVPVDLGVASVNGMSDNEHMVGAANSQGAYWASPTGSSASVPTPAGATFVSLLDVNNSGQIIGFATTSGVTSYYYWSSPTATPVAIKKPDGHLGIQVFAINNLGEMVGTSTVTSTSNAAKPTYWATPTAVPTLLMMPDGQTKGDAQDINDGGEIIGHFPPRSQTGTGYYWMSKTEMPEPVLLGSGSRANLQQINNNGQFAGSVVVGAEARPTKWTTPSSAPNMLSLLGTDTFGSAFSINDNNEVVGESFTNTGSIYRAVLWRASGVPAQLDTLFPAGSWKTKRCFSIGNNGSIYGDATLSGVDKDFVIVKN